MTARRQIDAETGAREPARCLADETRVPATRTGPIFRAARVPAGAPKLHAAAGIGIFVPRTCRAAAELGISAPLKDRTAAVIGISVRRRCRAALKPEFSV